MLIVILLLGSVTEIALCRIGAENRPRRALAIIDLVILALASGALLAMGNSVLTWSLMIINSYRGLNMYRLLEQRMHKTYLRQATSRTAVCLLFSEVIILFIAYAWRKFSLDANDTLIGIAIIQLIGATILLTSTVRTIIKTKHQQSTEYFTDVDLPTVTVAIPARNETEDLADCLRSVLANDYPKLEILVLDDCSQDKTPEIIRGFAHDGVRFIRGAQPNENWLAKNQAYAQLAEHANGRFILYCGVDVRLGSQAIRQLLTVALRKHKSMLCVLPRRIDSSIAGSFIQPLRYWWELALPRRLFNKPPVLSTCWLIEKRALKKTGGLSAVSRTIIPEAYFARELARTDGYSFIRSNYVLDIQTVKQFPQQLQTAVRTRYPQLHRRPETVLLVSIAEALLLVLPFVLAIIGFWLPLGLAHTVAIAVCLILVATHSLILGITSPNNWWLALLNFPVVIIAELILNHASLYQYEFSTVIWKGRNVCNPVMHVAPKLPPLA